MARSNPSLVSLTLICNENTSMLTHSTTLAFKKQPKRATRKIMTIEQKNQNVKAIEKSAN